MKTKFNSLFCALLAGLSLILGGCDNIPKPEDTTDPNTNISGKTDYSGKVNVDKSEVKVGIANIIDVIIPQGAFGGDATFTIKALDPNTLPASPNFKIYEAFEVSSSSGITFAKNIEINFKYDDTKGEKSAKSNGAAYYDEVAKKWIPFNDVSADTIQKIISINTNHLCKLGRTSYSRFNNGYTDWRSSSHFYIYWREPGVMTNQEYASPYKTSNVGDDPHYVQDILFYLEASWTAYKNAGLQVPSGKVNVYLDPLAHDGETTWMGSIYINQRLTTSKYLSVEEYLPTVCAHELLHYVQDYYYIQYVAGLGSQWWLEATAVQADRIVWPANKKFEALDPVNRISDVLGRSWDDCFADPNWYTAGKFLTYLANYRIGTKLNIPKIIIAGGSKTDLSHFRTIVDNYVRTNMQSTIGKEFSAYAKYTYEPNSNLKYEDHGAESNRKLSTINSTSIVLNNDITVPYLAVGFLSCQNQINILTESQTVYAKLTTKSDSLDVFAYEVTSTGTRTFIKQMMVNDSVTVLLPYRLKDIDLMVVNRSPSVSGTAKVTFRCGQLPFISSISPYPANEGNVITITGSKFGPKVASSDIYFNLIKINALSTTVKSWSDTKIEFFGPSDHVTGSVYVKTIDNKSNSVDCVLVHKKFKSVSIDLKSLKVTYFDSKNYQIPSNIKFLTTTITHFVSGEPMIFTGDTFSYTSATLQAICTLSSDEKSLVLLKIKHTGYNKYLDEDITVSNVPLSSSTIYGLTYYASGINFTGLQYNYVQREIQNDVLLGTQTLLSFSMEPTTTVTVSLSD